ncbi:MAG TPA: hypothetical protein PJ982_15850, partial [Lacipirellulaceae bacterium]|nr:hypothetical protein [Lacipirellulaceae bacterium]
AQTPTGFTRELLVGRSPLRGPCRAVVRICDNFAGRVEPVFAGPSRRECARVGGQPLELAFSRAAEFDAEPVALVSDDHFTVILDLFEKVLFVIELGDPNQHVLAKQFSGKCVIK